MDIKKYLSIFFLTITLLSCGIDKEKYTKELTNNIDELNDLLSLVEDNYKDIISSESLKNRVVFTDCDKLGYSSDDYVCDAKEILDKMVSANISEIRFEKEQHSCTTESKFTQVYFKRDKSSLEPIVYFLYEYCGSKDIFESQTIYYKPVNDFWGVYIDSNLP